MSTVRVKILPVILSLLFVFGAAPAAVQAAASGTSGSTKWSYSDNTIVFTGDGATDSYSGTDVPWVLKGAEAAKSSLTAKKVISVAEDELQYSEKKSNSSLYDKRANIGKNNYTKYAADLFPSLQANAWCDMFVSWCFWKAAGENQNTANKALCGGLKSAYTPNSASKYKADGRWTTTDPQVGDQVFFRNSSRICHTGIVYKVTDEAIYTIEGNTLSGKSSAASGGEVLRKMYARSYWKIAGYGHPIYSGSSIDTQLDISKVEFKDGVTKLGSYLFAHRDDVKTVVIPKSVKEISAYAFSYCEGIKDVYYAGSASDWNKIKIGTGNYYIEHADMHYGTTNAPKAESNSVSADGTSTSGSLRFTSQPSSTTVEGNKLHMFAVTTNQFGATYRWQVKEVGKSWRFFSEKWTAKTSILNFTVTPAMNGWKFRCKVTKGGTTITSKPFTVKVAGALKRDQAAQEDFREGGQEGCSSKSKSTRKPNSSGSTRNPAAASGRKVSSTKTAKTATLKLKTKKKYNGWKYRCKITSGDEVVYTKAVKLTVK